MKIEYTFPDVYNYVASSTRGQNLWAIPLQASGEPVDPRGLPAPDFSSRPNSKIQSLISELTDSLGLTKPKSKREAEQFFSRQQSSFIKRRLSACRQMCWHPSGH